MSLALYRTYRPGRLADVIGQEHVTGPLGRAIDSGRAHHAYLFTGPRGCGKTSTARILARSLNCEEGPTSEPCGVCPSCISLAPNGPGSIDVIEMDAASHRGIDDARELREKAMYAPAASRYKVYIIDEAHQLTVDAANALLKLIEEPPAHLKFVFATTEPDKILPTIRSRTHHYPYRLVPVRRLQEHLAWVCEQEGIPAEPEALALVARAGAGSVRDALSILGQLIAGTGPEGLTYDDTVSQLGVTDTAMLDEVVEALASDDGAAMFSVIDRVVEAGLDPRRFATDLLERLRDLVVLHEVPDAAQAGLLDAPDSQIFLMRGQAEKLGLAQLSRAADLVSTGLSELKGATAPRLQLELLCARLLLPAADDTDSGLAARLDRIERKVAFLGDAPAGAPVPPAPAPAPRPAAQPEPSRPAPHHDPAPRTVVPGGPPAPPRLSSVAPTTAPPQAPAEEAATPEAAAPPAPEPVSAPAPEPVAAPAAAAPASGGAGLGQITVMWPSVLEALKSSSRVAHTLAEGAVPLELDARTLGLAHPDRVRMGILRGNKGHMELLRLAVLDVARLDVEIDLVLDPSVSDAPAAPAPEPAAASVTEPERPSESGPSARERAAAVVAEEAVPGDDDVSVDDADAEGDLSGLALVQRELGGTVMTEYDNG
ncbi:MAG TPA: DNA polymerase III subunit gamma and tau [Candidatus Nanopelagicales bacterium]|nr:DNA polymerase III subunit gamma and tau [Candidatus Nanopelagicales bacterium]